jgi:hypothetical protein
MIGTATPYYPPQRTGRRPAFSNRRMWISPPRDYTEILAEYRARQAVLT